MHLDFECKGAYMELLMLQFNRGHMTSHMIAHVLGHKFDHIWPQIKDKFNTDGTHFWNERLKVEKEKRVNYSISRRKNLEGVNQHTKNKDIKGGHMTSHMESHMENENENINEDINTIKKGIVKGFKKPTIEDVEGYFYEKFTEGKETASHFYDHYESNGWKVGKNPMKDWRGAVRNWMRNKSNFNKNGTDKDKPAFGRLSKATIDRFIPPGTTNPHVEKYLKGDV